MILEDISMIHDTHVRLVCLQTGSNAAFGKKMYIKLILKIYFFRYTFYY